MGTDAQQTERLTLSVIVPVYNGEAFVGRTVRALIAHLESRDDRVELIVVDDGSTDATPAMIRAAAAGAAVPTRVLRNPRNQGKGAAIASGMRAAAGARVVFLDADLAYPPAEIDKICAALDAGADVAIASRVHPESRYLIRTSFFRYLYTRHIAGRFFNWLVRLILLPGISDSQAGLKGFTAAAAARIFAATLPRGFSFDLALLLRARRLGLTIREVGVNYRYDSEPTTVRFVLDTLVVLRDLVVLRLDALGRMPARIRHAWLDRLLAAEAAPAVLACAAAIGLAALVVSRVVLGSGALAVAAWLVMLLAIGGLVRRTDRRPRPWRCFRSWREAAVFGTIAAVGVALRFAWLGEVPPMEHLDSAECGLRGLALLNGEVPDPFDFSPWYNTPYVSFLPYAASFAAFGVSVATLRLPSAVVGSLGMAPLYVLVRTWFGARAALLATALFAVSHAAVHFSRIGLWNIQTLFLELSAFALIAAGMRRRSAFALYSAGIVSGLALYSYTAGRLVLVVAAAFFIVQTIWSVGRLRVLRLAAYYVLGAAAAAVPLALNYVKDPSALAADRAASVWVLAEVNRPHVEATIGHTTTPAILGTQLLRSLEGFVTLGDTSTQYGTTQPLLSPWIALLCVVGLAAALRRSAAPRYRFLLLWTALGLALGSVAVLDPPSYTRLVVLFPVPCILAAIGLAAVLRRVSAWRPLSQADATAAGVIVAVLAVAFNLGGYHRFVETMRQMPREWDVLSVVNRFGNHNDYYLFTGPFLLADSPLFQLFAPDARAVSGFSEQDLPERLAQDSVFVIQGSFRGLGAAISERFPGATREVLAEGEPQQLLVYQCSLDNGCRSAVN